MFSFVRLLLQTLLGYLVQVTFGLPAKYVPLTPFIIYFKLVVENCAEKEC